MKKIVVCVVVCLLAGSANAALIVVDDFNNGNTDGWTIQNESVKEINGTVSGDNLSLMTMNGQTSNSIGVDAIPFVNQPGYIALILNYSSLNDHLFVKIQDNNANGLYDRVFFYHGFNNSVEGVFGTYFFDLAFEVSSTYFEVTDNGNGTVSAFVGATGETFGGTLNHTYTGTGIGLGFFGKSKADNFYSVPEPATISLLALGGLLLRKRSLNGIGQDRHQENQRLPR